MCYSLHMILKIAPFHFPTRRRVIATLVIGAIGSIGSTANLSAANWPQFRGADSRGVAADNERLPEQWSESENAKVFGASADMNYHGHDYICDVTVRGQPDSRSGMVVDLAELDRVLSREVRDRFDDKTINVEVSEFLDGRLPPSGENIARIIFERVRASLVSEVHVTEVTVAEDDTLRASYRGD